MKELSARSYYVGNELKIAEIDKKTELQPIIRKRDLLIYELSKDVYALAYSFGVWVFVGYDPKMEKAYIKKFLRYVVDPQEKHLTEEYGIVVDETLEKDSAEFNRVLFRVLDVGRVTLLAEVLAQSVAMDHFENLVEEMSVRLEKMNINLSSRGKLPNNTKAIVKLHGTDNLILQFVLSRLSILDSPDLVWENEEYEKIYGSLRNLFDLRDRFETLQAKLNFTQNNSQFFLELLQDRRSGRMELAILFVIIIETLLVVWELFG